MKQLSAEEELAIIRQLHKSKRYSPHQSVIGVLLDALNGRDEDNQMLQRRFDEAQAANVAFQRERREFMP